MTEVRARSWESTASLPRADRSLKVAALWAVVTVLGSLLASAGVGHLSPLSKTELTLAGAAAAHRKQPASVIVHRSPAPVAAERKGAALPSQQMAQRHVPANPPTNLALIRLAEAPRATDVSGMSSSISTSGKFWSGNSWSV
jgi:hypothetical protein